MIKAYKTFIKGFGSAYYIYRATSPGKAKSLIWKAATEAGYEIDFTEVVAVRAKEFDEAAQRPIDLSSPDPYWLGHYYEGYCYGCLLQEKKDV